MNLHVTGSTVGVLRVLVMLWAGRLNGSCVVGQAMASQTQLVDRAVLQQPRIRRTVRCMTGRASFGFYRSVFVSKRPLLIHVALNASGVGAGRESGLLQLETAMRIVTIGALHETLVDAVLKRHGELRPHGQVAGIAQIVLPGRQQKFRRRRLMNQMAIRTDHVCLRMG